MSLPIAVQLYSVRDRLEKDFRGTLEQVKALGFEGVEFAGLYGHAPEEIRTMLAEIGLTAVSAHVPIDALTADLEKTVSDYRTIGCRFIVVPWLDENRRPGHPGYAKTVEDIRAIGEETKRQGMILLYHNHDFEFVKVDGEYALDLLYAGIPADLLQTEIDTCWVNVAGENPADYVRKYAGRAPVVHLKDFIMPGRKPARMYELIGVDDSAETKADEVFEFRPVGHGCQDFPAILSAAAYAGAEWVVVEQDMPSLGKTSMECVQMGIEYLKGL